MPRCIFCLKQKDVLTKEHIIPAALGSNIVLQNASCEECQTQCNKSFEQRFLKGSNFVSMIRANLGIRGRRNEPIFGFDRHGHPLTISVQQGFPPIRIGLAYQRIERPMQVILMDDRRNPISYHFLPDKIERPLLPEFFSGVVENVPDNVKLAALWADGDIIPANPWREILEAFTAWSNRSGLLPFASSIASGEARVELNLDWNTEDRNRGLTKICFMYALSKLAEKKRFSPAFEASRQYILDGTHHPNNYWKHSPVLQWNGPYPGADVIGKEKFTYFLSLVIKDNCLFGLIRLLNIGLFVVKLSNDVDGRLGENFLSLFLLNRENNDKYSLIENEHSADNANNFAKAVIASGQL